MLLGLVVGRLPINFCVREKPTRKIISSCVSSNIFIVCLFTLCEESFEKRGHFRTNLYLTIIYIGVAQKFVMHDITKEITRKANYLRTFKRLSLHENRSFNFYQMYSLQLFLGNAKKSPQTSGSYNLPIYFSEISHFKIS